MRVPLAPDAMTPAILWSLVALAAVVRGIGLDAQPLWLDEVLSLNRASLPPAALITDALNHLHYPTYFLLLSAVLWWLGDGNWALRLPSLLFGVLCVPLGYAIARRMAGSVAGLAAAALFALAPVQVMYSQEARSYTLTMLLIMVALWGFVRLATDARVAAAAPRDLLMPENPAHRDARTSWAALIAGTGGALMVLSIAVFWLITLLVGLMVLRQQLSPADRRAFGRTALLALSLIGLIWLPWAAAISPAVIGTIRHGFWAPPPTLASVADAIWAVYLLGVADPLGFEPIGDLAPLRVVGVIAAAAAGAYGQRDNPAVLWILVGGAALPPALLAAASAFTPVFVPRYLCAGAPAFLVLAACGGAAAFRALSRARSLAAVAAVVLVADLANNLRAYHRAEIKPRWDLAAQLLAESVHEDDRILFHNGFARWIVETKLRRTGTLLPQAIVLSGPEALDRNGFTGRVWVAYGRVAQSAAPDDAQIRRWLAEWGEPSDIERIGRQVRIAIFELRPPETRLRRRQPAPSADPRRSPIRRS